MRQTLLCAVLAGALLLALPARAFGGETVTVLAPDEGEARAVLRAVPGAAGREVGAKAAIVIEARTGAVLFAQNENTRLPMASTTKIMTALLALEQPGLDEAFPVDTAAIHVEGTSMGLRDGDTVTLRALAIGMLLPSGNDAANAAAVRVAGDIPSFAAQMNGRARALGMADTSFVTPSGLDAEGHYSTARDMAVLTRRALQNPDFAAICSQYRMRAGFGNPPGERWMRNHNRFLTLYDGAYGVKTGYTRKAGRCLVTAVRRGGVELICVTLGCPDDWNTHTALYDRIFPTLEAVDLTAAVAPAGVRVVGGAQARVPVRPTEDTAVALPTGGVMSWRLVAQPFLYAPVRRGDFVGEARCYVGGRAVYAIPLAAARDIPLLHPYEEKKPWYEWIVRLFWDG